MPAPAGMGTVTGSPVGVLVVSVVSSAAYFGMPITYVCALTWLCDAFDRKQRENIRAGISAESRRIHFK